MRDLAYVPDELEGLEKQLSDTYYCNFSLFQSLPDHWAVRQLFPTMPIHRLNKQPTRRAVLADLTCDSDGKMDQFIDLARRQALPRAAPAERRALLHRRASWSAPTRRSWATCTTSSATPTPCTCALDGDDYRVEHVVEGDSVTEVLSYVQYSKDDLISRVRRAVEAALRDKRLTLAESGRLMRRYEEALEGYTYLTVKE